MSFVIAELKTGERGGFAPRGAVRDLWKSRDFETIVAGPAETGKTWGCLQYLDALLWRYPGAQAVMARKTYASLVGSALRTYKRILGAETPVRAFGGSKPEWFDYPNGSRLWIVGLDNPGKALSSERDFIYINQAEELSLEDWETLITRVTGRGAVAPYTRIFGDCNPSYPTHWIKRRAAEGKLLLLESRHEDNPTLYDDDLKLTEQGRRSIAALDSLSGTRRERLRFGRWVQAEGVVYEDWDRRVHLWRKRPDWWKPAWALESIDFGFTNPFTWGHYEVDGDGRMLLALELYGTGRIVSDWAAKIKRARRLSPFQARAVVADHDAEDRATLLRCGITTLPAHKDLSPGIQGVQARLKPAGDGKARFFVLESALQEADPDLVEKRLPTCSAEEFEVYAYPQSKDGKPIKEEPVKIYDHGMDRDRYAVAYVDGLGRGHRPGFRAGKGRPAQ